MSSDYELPCGYGGVHPVDSSAAEIAELPDGYGGVGASQPAEVSPDPAEVSPDVAEFLRGANFSGRGPGRPRKYPMYDMAVGETRSIPATTPAKRVAVRTAATHCGLRLQRQFITRSNATHVFVVRIA